MLGWGTAVIFVLLGCMQGTLASRMPALKTNAGLDDGLLGLALLGIPPRRRFLRCR